MTTKTVLAAVAAFAVLAVSAGAFAAAAGGYADTVSVKVSLAGVDLQSPPGAEVALGRIHQAARQVCGVEAADDLAGRARYAACLSEVTDRAVASLDNRMVTALNGPVKGSGKVILAASR
jgi:UrcA family protein